MQILKPYFHSQDPRGAILGVSQFDWMREINYIESLAGTVRGGHYHKKTRELFFVIDGEIRVEVRHLETGDRQEITVGKGDLFIIEPLEIHTFHVLRDAKWINVLSVPMDPTASDFFYVK